MFFNNSIKHIFIILYYLFYYKFISYYLYKGLQLACLFIMLNLIDIKDEIQINERIKSKIIRRFLIIFSIIQMLLSIGFIVIQICHQYELLDQFKKLYVFALQMFEFFIGILILIIAIKLAKYSYKMEKSIYKTGLLIMGISLEFLTFVILFVSINIKIFYYFKNLII